MHVQGGSTRGHALETVDKPKIYTLKDMNFPFVMEFVLNSVVHYIQIESVLQSMYHPLALSKEKYVLIRQLLSICLDVRGRI